LADPRPANHKDIVNKKIKFREEFRPFAPSVLEEYAQEWFEIDIPSPYMLLIPKIRENYRTTIQAVTHVDGTARVQTVSQTSNPNYYELIQEFLKLTGCPILLNTSFNVKGEPIVDSPADAVRYFFSTGLDYFFLEDFIITKEVDLAKIAKLEE
jgi:carbamoyltransferase